VKSETGEEYIMASEGMDASGTTLQ